MSHDDLTRLMLRETAREATRAAKRVFARFAIVMIAFVLFSYLAHL